MSECQNCRTLEDRIEELRKELNVVARNSHSIITELEARIKGLEADISELNHDRQNDFRNYESVLKEGRARVAEQADELKIAEQGRIALRSKIAEQAAEIERLKAANEGWHRRVPEYMMEFGPEKESYQQRIEELEVENKSLKGVSVLDRLGNALEQVGIYQQRVINLKEKITQHNLELELTRKVARDRIAELESEIKRLRVELTREIK